MNDKQYEYNRFLNARERLKKVEPDYNLWTDEDFEYIKAIRDALEMAMDIMKDEGK